jgi:hypothetical protein
MLLSVINSISQLIFVMVKSYVLFDVRTVSLNTIYASLVFKQLLLHASHAALQILNSSKLPPVVDAADLIVFQIIDKTIRNSNSSLKDHILLLCISVFRFYVG